MGKKFKVYVSYNWFGKYCSRAIKLIESVAQLEKNPSDRILSREELINEARESDGLILAWYCIDKNLLNNLSKVKIIGWHAAGLDGVDLKAATEAGVVIVYPPGANADSVAEYTLGLILSATKRIPKADTLAKLTIWDFQLYRELYERTIFGIELKGKTLGIIGLGEIGSRVARLAKPLGMKLFAYDPYISPEKAKKYGVKLVTLENLLKESDIITIHCQLTEETRGMINKKTIGLMKDGVYLINTARGAIVNENDLYNALRRKKIAFAALDVLSKEPPQPDNPLLKLDNVIITPHIAGYTPEALGKKDLMLAEDLVHFFKGKKPRHVANPDIFKKNGAKLTLGNF
jgi:D-3-phosphoglycerate dehydrogenase